jgi:putative protease
MKFVDKLLNSDIYGLIIGDISTIKLVRKEYPRIHLTASNVVEVNNSESVMFIEDCGASRVIIPYQITLDEIAAIRERVKIEIEVFGHYGCSFHDGFCMFKHNVGEAGFDGIDVGTPCRNFYCILGETNEVPKTYLDSSLICSVCSIPALMKYGVDVLKLVRREISEASNAELTKIYRKVIDISYKREVIPRYSRRSYPRGGRVLSASTNAVNILKHVFLKVSPAV